LALTSAKNLYSEHKYSVTPLSRANWENMIVKARSRIVAIVHFYKYTDYESKEFAEKFKEESIKSDGIFKFAGVDCDEHYDICEKQSVSKFPTVKIYPTLPAPDF
jgi:thioredoxin-like negative regulator of GroEL